MCCVPPVVLPLPGTRTVVDLREILVTLLERLCAWPLADECLDRIRMNLARAVCRGSLFWQHDRNEALRKWLQLAGGQLQRSGKHVPSFNHCPVVL